MTDAEFIAIELADAYGLDPVRFMDASAFLLRGQGAEGDDARRDRPGRSGPRRS